MALTDRPRRQMQDEAPPIDKLKRHIAELRSKMSFDLSNKENERILSPSGLARSPHTRNVSVSSKCSSIMSSTAYPPLITAQSEHDPIICIRLVIRGGS